MSIIDTKIEWPGWETVRMVGAGSYGRVYEIHRTVFDITESSALKVISIPRNESEIEELKAEGYDSESIREIYRGQLETYVSEYSLMRKLNGVSNIVGCDDFLCLPHEDGFGWDLLIKMELLSPMMDTIPQKYSEESVLKIAMDLCAGLISCGKNNIIHRDVKPQNIFVSKDGIYKLGDFGVAKISERTMSGTQAGTYKYMAPEVYYNKPYGASADIYSLGIVLYQLMNERRLPFFPLPPEKVSADAENRAKELRFSGQPLPAPVHGSDGLVRIVQKACAYDSLDRYKTAQDMYEDLLNFSRGVSVNVSQVIPAKKTAEVFVQKPKEKKTFLKKALFICLTVCVVAAIFSKGVQTNSFQRKYDEAMELKEAGEYKEASILFSALTVFRDSNEQMLDCFYLQQEENLMNLRENQVVRFGAFEQDGDLRNGPEEIEWRVLQVENGQALLFCEHILCGVPFSEDEKESNWENCSLREWLNSIFLQSAFGEKHQNLIAATTLNIETNKKYGTKTGKETCDKIFILSTDEVEMYSEQYFPILTISPTNAYKKDLKKRDFDSFSFWLRTPGATKSLETCISGSGSGEMDFNGVSVTDENGLRPVIVINGQY